MRARFPWGRQLAWVVLWAAPAVTWAQRQPLPYARGAAADPDARLAPRTVGAVRVAGRAPTVDGRLDDAVWQTAPVATDFVQSRPRPGAPATFRTEARVAFDDAAVYVAVRCFDPHPDSIVAPFPRRDDETRSDWVFVEIDTRRDRRTALSFGVNPRGAQVDGVFTNDRDYDAAWNAVWSAVARTDSAGWTAEYRIPLSQLGIAGTPGAPLGFNVYRYVPRLGESSNWSPRLPTHTGVVSHFNELRGLTVPPSGRSLEVTPYVAAREARAPAAAGDLSSAMLPRGATTLAGVDARLRVTPGLVAAATVRPDFGQVEADPSVVNLTTFETFFPEQRPFFVERADVFAFHGGAGLGIPFRSRGRDFAAESPFYSRRIGRAPRTPEDGRLAGLTVLDAPAQTDVLAAAKLAGRLGAGWSLGVLGVRTADAEARVLDSAGTARSVALEPATDVAIVRAARDFRRGASAVGALLTGVRRDDSDSWSRDALARDALTLGLDARHRLAGDAIELSGFVAASRVAGTASAIRALEAAPPHDLLRPDASHLARYRDDSTRTVLGGVAAEVLASKPGGHWRWSVAGHAVSPAFDANDVGFQRHADWLLAVGALRYEQFRPGRRFRRWSLGVDQVGAGWSFGGERRAANATLAASADLPNEWGGTATLGRDAAALSTETLRGGPALLLPPRTAWTATVHSDGRRAVQLTLAADGFTEHAPAGHGASLSADLAARVVDRLRVEVAPTLSDESTAWQDVGRTGTGGDARHVVGRLGQRTAAVVVRADFAFSSRLTLQGYAQPLVGVARYGDFGLVAEPRAADPAARVQPLALDATGLRDPSFGTRQATGTAVLRWEYRPGSTLFVVWTDQRQDDVADARWRLTRSVRALGGAPATDVLLVKWSYWWIRRG